MEVKILMDEKEKKLIGRYADELSKLVKEAKEELRKIKETLERQE